jgi:hypothetical protein
MSAPAPSASIAGRDAVHSVSRLDPSTAAAVAAPPGNAAREGAHMMKSLIGVVDLSSGAITGRPQDSLTLDIPSDLDPAGGVVSLNAAKLGHYVTSSGERREYSARPVLLSRRAPGEECLVAWTEIDAAGEPTQYRLAMVDLDD